MTPSRLAVAVYGTLAYILFLGTFTYTIGFVLGIAVPKDIDAPIGEPLSTWKALAINAGFLTLFAVQHLIMARDWFKRWIQRYIPQAAERSTFVVATCAILIGMFVFWQPMPLVIWDVQSIPVRGALYTIGLIGFLGVVYTTFLIDHFELFGMKQVLRNLTGQKAESPQFLVRSVYCMARHPMYTFMLMGFWIAPTMTLGHLLFAALVTAFVIVGVQFEERGLIRKHGVTYLEYRAALPMLFPRFGRYVAPVNPQSTPKPNLGS